MTTKIELPSNPVLKPPRKADPTRYMIRTRDAGVFMARIDVFDPKTGEARLLDARRIWYWSGAATLSELAVEGTVDAGNCKFPVAVERMTVLGVIEVATMTERAAKSIDDVPIWTADP